MDTVQTKRGPGRPRKNPVDVETEVKDWESEAEQQEETAEATVQAVPAAPYVSTRQDTSWHKLVGRDILYWSAPTGGRGQILPCFGKLHRPSITDASKWEIAIWNGIMWARRHGIMFSETPRAGHFTWAAESK